jgi:mannitol 2-dehydrogenase
MAENCLFPNSMVDRIPPATTDEHRAFVKEKFGIDDGWPVMTESFKQWVIEDHFVQGRPKWEKVGAQMTGDVLPYEKMKLRLLNASHQALCYIGMLLGYQLIHETMEDADFRKLVEKMMDEEVTPILSPVPGVDLYGIQEDSDRAFCESGNSRSTFTYRNLWFVGNSQVRPAVDRGAIEARGPIKLLSFTIAPWLRYLSGMPRN